MMALARFLVVSVVVALQTAVLPAPAQADDLAWPARGAETLVKTQVAVDADIVTLGDLLADEAFAQAPAARAVAVAMAPAPGATGTIGIERVRRLAEAQGLRLAGTDGFDVITVTRTGVAIGAPQIEAALLDALAARGLTGPRRIRFTGPEPVLHVAAGGGADIAVEALELDRDTGQFRAQLRASAGDPRARRVAVAGRAYAVAEIPVLLRELKPGEIIGARDLGTLEIPAERLTQNMIAEARDLEGQAAKRTLRPHVPLAFTDIERPIAVTKNSLVTMIVKGSGMTLTAQGRALEDGALGETIRVLNTQSKRTIEATVNAAGEVVVKIASTKTASRS